jgi:hypothetical protein
VRGPVYDGAGRMGKVLTLGQSESRAIVRKPAPPPRNEHYMLFYPVCQSFPVKVAGDYLGGFFLSEMSRNLRVMTSFGYRGFKSFIVWNKQAAFIIK